MCYNLKVHYKNLHKGGSVMDDMRFVHRTVKEALFLVRKCIEDDNEVADKSIGILYRRRAWKRIVQNFEEFRDFALTKNLDVTVSNDGTRHIYYKLIKKEIWQ